jgi:Fimbrial assembly protein (PilN)
MTTALTPAEIAALDGGALRIVPIMADLLPAEVVERRRHRQVRRVVLAALIGVLVLLGAWYASARYQTAQARQQLTEAQDTAARVQSQQAQYQGVVSVQEQSTEISKQLAGLMALDLRWSTVVDAVQQAAPTGVKLHGLSAATTASGATGGSTSDTELPGSGEKKIGELTISGEGSSKALVAEYVDRLAKIHGVLDPLLSSAVEQKEGVQFTMKMDLTTAVLGGRFTTRTGSGGN